MAISTRKKNGNFNQKKRIAISTRKKEWQFQPHTEIQESIPVKVYCLKKFKKIKAGSNFQNGKKQFVVGSKYVTDPKLTMLWGLIAQNINKFFLDLLLSIGVFLQKTPFYQKTP